MRYKYRSITPDGREVEGFYEGDSEAGLVKNA